MQNDFPQITVTGTLPAIMSGERKRSALEGAFIV